MGAVISITIFPSDTSGRNDSIWCGDKRDNVSPRKGTRVFDTAPGVTRHCLREISPTLVKRTEPCGSALPYPISPG